MLIGSASSTFVDEKGHVLLSSPTLEALPESNLGSIVGGAVGGALFLLLLLALVGVCYLRKQQTFHGNYYTKQYLGPNDLQKAPTQHELHPTKAGSSSYHRDHDREEWGDRQLKHERDRRHHSNFNGEEYPSNGYTRAMRESTHHSHQQNHHREHTQYSSPRQARCARYTHSPKPQGNCSPYLSDDCYDSGPEGDYVSHTDGSVISRREWYVWQATWFWSSENATEVSFSFIILGRNTLFLLCTHMHTSTNLNYVIPSFFFFFKCPSWDWTYLFLMWTDCWPHSYFDSQHLRAYRVGMSLVCVCVEMKDHNSCGVSALLYGLPIYVALLMSLSWA